MEVALIDCAWRLRIVELAPLSIKPVPNSKSFNVSCEPVALLKLNNKLAVDDAPELTKPLLKCHARLSVAVDEAV